MTFLFLLLLLLAIYFVLRPFLRVYKSFRNVQDAFYGKHAHKNTNTESSHQHKQKDEKIIPKEYGEYVEFTETKSYSEDTIKSETHSKTYNEEQISDAEWEDVK